MSNSGAAPTGWLMRAVGWARKSPTTRVAGPAAGVALLVSGAFGGLAPVQAEYDDVEAGEVVHSGPFDVSVDRVRAMDTLLPAASPSEEGNRLLAIVFKLRNPTKEPVLVGLLRNELTIEVEGAELTEEPPRMLSINDSSSRSEFQPDVDYEFAMVYETVGDDVATEVTIGLPKYVWREDSFTQGFFDWKDPEIVARGTYPVKDVPDEPVAGDEG